MTVKAVAYAPGKWHVYSLDATSNSGRRLVGDILTGGTPAVPATTVAVTNTSVWPEYVTITGGTVTVVKINGGTTGRTSGGFSLPPKNTISITYSVKPVWSWSSQGKYFPVQRKALVGSAKTSLSQALNVFARKGH